MITSMTGFGSATQKNKKMSVVIQIKTVNGRFFEPKFRTPKIYQSFESEMKNIIHAKIQRGNVDIQINRSLAMEIEGGMQVIPNLGLAKSWWKAAAHVAEELSLKLPPSIDSILRVPEIFQVQENFLEIEDSEKDLILMTLSLAVEKCVEERNREGRELSGELSKLLESLATFCESVDARKADFDGSLKKNLEKKIKKLSSEYALDDHRLNQEALFLIERADISEEIARLKSHIAGFKKAMNEDKSVGKKLDFLVQEFHREVNTMSSKTQALDIVLDVIEAKTVVEKIREQVQNIE